MNQRWKGVTRLPNIIQITLVLLCVLLSPNSLANIIQLNDGDANLAQWNRDLSPIQNINGNWHFRLGSHTEPNSIDLNNPKLDTLRTIPDLWGIPQGPKERFKYSNTGQASYMLNMYNIPNEQLTLNFNRVCSSADIFLIDHNGPVTHLGKIGSAGDSDSNTLPRMRPVTLNLPRPTPKNASLLVNISNFHLRDGGMCDRVELGVQSAVRNSEIWSISSTMVTLGILFGVAIYSLGLSIQNPIESSSKWLVAVCTSAAVFFMSTESMLEFLFSTPNLTSFELHFKMRYLGILFFSTSLHRMSLAALKRRNETKLERGQRIIGWIFAVFIIFFSTSDFTMFVPILALIFGYNFYRSLREIYKAWRFNEPGALWLLVGIFALTLAMLMQPLSYTLHNEARIAIQVAVIIFVFLQSQFIGLRFKNALNESRFLSEHLQEEISRKTRDIKQQQKELLAVRGELKSASFIDKTTGIYSRAYFENQLEVEWSRCLRESRPLALVLFDMDGSKKINHDFGRSAGDQWLFHFAHKLGEHVRRQTDIAARYGGDEFVLLLPDCNLEEAMTIAENFLQDIHNSTLKLGDEELKFSVTAGLQAVTPDDDSSATEELINRAVVALHQAKDTQRGQVRIYKAKCAPNNDSSDPTQG